MLTVALVLALLVAAVAVCMWLAAERSCRALAIHNRHLRNQVAGYRAELDALSIAGPQIRVDTRTGSHDQLPIREDIRHMLTDYVEGMWHHTQEQP